MWERKGEYEWKTLNSALRAGQGQVPPDSKGLPEKSKPPTVCQGHLAKTVAQGLLLATPETCPQEG